MKYSFMIGVLPGYGHENEGLNEETAMQWGKKAYEEVASPEKFGKVQLATAIYSKEWGCPAGGELGVSISGEAETMEEVEEIVKAMMQKLGQSTCMIEFEDDEGHSLGSSYVKYKGENVDHNDPTNGEKFQVKIPLENVNMHEMGERLQEEIVKVGSMEGMYFATGELTRGKDEKTGKEYLMYSGSQNPMFSPDTQKYRESAYCTIRNATHDCGPLCIKFNEQSVVINEKTNDEQEKETEPEIETEI